MNSLPTSTSSTVPTSPRPPVADLGAAADTNRLRSTSRGERFAAHLDRVLGAGDAASAADDTAARGSVTRSPAAGSRPEPTDGGRPRSEFAEGGRSRGDRSSLDRADRSERPGRAPARRPGDDAGDAPEAIRAGDSHATGEVADRDRSDDIDEPVDATDAGVRREPTPIAPVATPATEVAAVAGAVHPAPAPAGEPDTAADATLGAGSVGLVAGSGVALAEAGVGPIDGSDVAGVVGAATASFAATPTGVAAMAAPAVPPAVAPSDIGATDPTPLAAAATEAVETAGTVVPAPDVAPAPDAAAADGPQDVAPRGPSVTSATAGDAAPAEAAELASSGASSGEMPSEGISGDGIAGDSVAIEASTAPGAPTGEQSRTATSIGLRSPSGRAVDGVPESPGVGAAPVVTSRSGAVAASESAASGQGSGEGSGQGSGQGSGHGAGPGTTAPVATGADVGPHVLHADMATTTGSGASAEGTRGAPGAEVASGPGRPTSLDQARAAADAASLRAPGLDRISIDLSDEGLGPLTLQAANGAGGLHVRLTAGDRSVGDALAGASEQLRRDLESSGTTLGSLDVGHRGDDRSGRSFLGAAADEHRGRRPGPGDPSATAAVATATPQRLDRTGVDLRI